MAELQQSDPVVTLLYQQAKLSGQGEGGMNVGGIVRH